MRKPVAHFILTGAAVLFAAGAGLAVVQLPAIGASALLHPLRRPVRQDPPESCVQVSLTSAGLTLKGWRQRAEGARRGTIVYLHGVADNRASAAGVMAR